MNTTAKTKHEQPKKIWGERLNLEDDYTRGAYEAYCGLGVNYRAKGKSQAYKAGRKEQLACLPKKRNGRVNWGLYSQGTWHETRKSGLEHWGY